MLTGLLTFAKVIFPAPIVLGKPGVQYRIIRDQYLGRFRCRFGPATAINNIRGF